MSSLAFRCFVLAASVALSCACECNVTFGDGLTIDVENRDVCGYVQYHVVMFFSFGCFFIMFMFMVVVKVARYGFNASHDQQDEIMHLSRCAACCAVLMMGIEFALALCYVIVAFICAMECLSILFPCARSVFAGFAACLTTVVAYQRAVVSWVWRDTSVHPEITEPCCICLESGGNGPWFHAKCKHSYHAECIKDWKRGTCPLCRRPI